MQQQQLITTIAFLVAWVAVATIPFSMALRGYETPFWEADDNNNIKGSSGSSSILRYRTKIMENDNKSKGTKGTKSSSMKSSKRSKSSSKIPSASPSSLSDLSSAQPSVGPSLMPSMDPSTQPSMQPSSVPSASTQPSEGPSSMPSRNPSAVPSKDPSLTPSVDPSSMPSLDPSTKPSVEPSDVPSSTPSWNPSFKPSVEPSKIPSGNPSDDPCANGNTIADIVCDNTTFPELVNACILLTEIGLLPSFNISNTLTTLFAPTNAAFFNADPFFNLILDSPSDVIPIIVYHVVPGMALRLEELVCNGNITMADMNTTQTICDDDDAIPPIRIAQVGTGQQQAQALAEVGDPSFQVTPNGVNIEACNGVIHILNAVMIPQELIPPED